MTTEEMLYTTLDSPIGELLLLGDAAALRGLYMQDAPNPRRVSSAWRRAPERFAEETEQLGDYFDGRRTSFELPLALRGTPFQLRVWEALQEIGYGETMGYGELARHIGRPGAARAVGLANGSNPVAVIVPCHRVIAADGGIGGYGGGVQRKRLLLELEARTSRAGTPLAAAR